MTSEPLPANEIHLHVTEDPTISEPSLLAANEGFLSPDELQRRARFRFGRHRHQFLVSRAPLRTTLTYYQPSVSPQDWRFELNMHGRPRISGDAGRELDFNLTHTDGCIVVAVSRIEMPGVDIEALERTDDVIDLARQFFAPSEIVDLLKLEPALQRRRFFDLWTLKEAYLKARGLGLSIPLNAFTIRFPGDHHLSIDCNLPDTNDFEQWQLWSIELSQLHSLSLAIKQGVLQIFGEAQMLPFRG